MIKIAFIIDTIATPSAGTEKQLLMLMHELDKSKFKPHLICLQKSEWLENNEFPFEVHILDVYSIISFGFIKALLKFRKLHNEKKFDIIQTFFIDSNIFGTLAAKIAGCQKLISSRRNIGYWHSWIHICILRLFAFITPYYLCNSLAARDKTIEIEKADPSKIHVIYNGIELRKFISISKEMRQMQRDSWGVSENEILIGAVANLRPVKNIHIIIESAARLVKEFSNLKFIVVGEGNLRTDLQNKINEQMLGDTFILAGRIDNVLKPLAAFDIAVMPSLSESFSNSLLEYMAAKLPIVTSNAGGNSEAIEHNKTGLLFSLDDEDGLFNGIKTLLSDKETSKKLAQTAFDLAVKTYDKSNMIRNHQTYYENLK